LNDTNHYLQQFKSFGLEQWRIRCVDQTWYTQKFEWKIEFNFSTNPEHRRYGVDHRWVQILRECEVLNFEFRKRREVWASIYTSDAGLLEHIISREEYRTAIISLEYTNSSYLEQRSSQTQLEAITDIKFVKTVPEHCYHIFLGKGQWREDHIKRSLTEYLVANSNEFLFKGYCQDLITRCRKNPDDLNRYSNYQGVYDSFNFFAKSTDDILLLHMIAPGKIKKIVKLMERAQ
jgi:hypothetical protein